MITCRKCHKNPAAAALGLCADCLRRTEDENVLAALHAPVRRKYGLPVQPPKNPAGIECRLCANCCRMGEGEQGFCGIHYHREGHLHSRAPQNSALAYMYLDPLPTNCCAAWFCRGSREPGYNLAVFFYGCNFDCLFCQNASHKLLDQAQTITADEMMEAALNPQVRCVCFFGGSPEPQLPFALKVARRIIEASGNRKHICWEWNGCGHPALVQKAAELSARSGGTVKFDLKAFHPHIAHALCGVPNRRALENFQRVHAQFPQSDVLTATTLLVPFYTDKTEVEQIARFIADCSPDIPYSLLIFHPDFYLKDLPVTPRRQVEECYRVARKYLKRVNIGNEHLLQFAGLD